MSATSIVNPVSTGFAVLKLERDTCQRNGKVSTGCEAIDRTLQGGLAFREITTIAASDANVRSVLSYHVIITHLLQRPRDEAVMIDTTGSFSVHTLRDVALEKLKAQSEVYNANHEGYMCDETKQEDSLEMSDDVAALLDRVKITRVFDFTGLVDAVSDVRATFLDAENSTRSRMRYQQPPRSVAEAGRDEERKGEFGISLLVADDIAAVLQPILIKSNVEAQALLVSLHRLLLRLVQDHQVCTVLFNGIVGTARLKSSSQNEYEESEKTDNTSMFPSVQGRPALGQTFLHLADLSLMVLTLPRRKEDAEAAYNVLTSQESEAWRSVKLVEVVKDRYGCRQDNFAVFQVHDSRLEGMGRKGREKRSE